MAVIDEKKVAGNGKTTTQEAEVRPVAETRGEKVARITDVGGMMIGGLAGLVAGILAIFGLLGFLPRLMDSVAVIVIGGVLLFHGVAVAGRYFHLLAGTGRLTLSEIGGGLSVNVIGGIAGIVLGILALLGIASLNLLSVAAIVYGASLILGAGMTTGLYDLVIERSGVEESFRRVAREAVAAVGSMQMLVGLGSLVLGILALLGTTPLTLTLTAMLALGFTTFITGSTAGAKMMSLLRR